MANYAWAENAVITKDDGGNVAYHPKCPHCGNVNSSVTANSYVCGRTNAGSFSCHRCGKSFSVRLGRD